MWKRSAGAVALGILALAIGAAVSSLGRSEDRRVDAETASEEVAAPDRARDTTLRAEGDPGL